MADARNIRGQIPTRTMLGAAARLRAKLQHLRGAENRRRVIAKVSPDTTANATATKAR